MPVADRRSDAAPPDALLMRCSRRARERSKFARPAANQNPLRRADARAPRANHLAVVVYPILAESAGARQVNRCEANAIDIPGDRVARFSDRHVVPGPAECACAGGPGLGAK